MSSTTTSPGSDARKPSAARFKADEAVTIIVGSGDKAERFMVHRHLLEGSRFFTAALQGEWKEATMRTITLAEDDPAVFGVYINWIYEKTISTDIGQDTALIQRERLLLIKAYILGDMIGDDHFCDAAIDGIIRVCRERHRYFSNENIVLIYESCRDGSKLRKLVVDQWLHKSGGSWITRPLDKIQKEFFMEATCAFVRARKRPVFDLILSEKAPWLLDPCAYHLHEMSSKDCYLNKAVQKGDGTVESTTGEANQGTKRKRDE